MTRHTALQVIGLTAIAAICSGLLGGCGSPQTVEGAQNRDRATGAAGGAIIGGIGGNLLGDALNVDRGTSTAIGAGVGGAAGLAVGNEMANRRGEYAADLEKIDKAVAETEAQIASIDRQTAAVERRVASQRDAVASLEAQVRNGQDVKSQAVSTLQEIDASLVAQREAANAAQAEISLLNGEIGKLDGLLAKYPGEQELVSRRGQLVSQRDGLAQRLGTLSGVETTIVAQRDRTRALTGG